MPSVVAAAVVWWRKEIVMRRRMSGGGERKLDAIDGALVSQREKQSEDFGGGFVWFGVRSA